ncbi:MAG: CHAT domain-containing protein [Egibacteraceae bacterium]
MGLVDLKVYDYAGPARWRWQLTGPGGRFLADHEVDLDPTAAEFEAFTDLHAYLGRFAAPGDRRAASETELVDRIGAWIGETVLGPVGAVLAAEAPVTVRLRLPVDAKVLGYRSWELGWANDRPLGLHGVTFVCQPADSPAVAKTPVGQRLRMLAVFSLPVDADALNLRRERYALTRLIHTIGAVNGKAIELRVLQYGVTRDRLAEMLLESDGWDIVHLSGHGLPAGLLLEHTDGRTDLISSPDLVDLLAPARGQVKLVTVSSCSSAALTATEHLRLLGIPDPAEPERGGPAEPDGSVLPALAAELEARLGCAVLAMRYPVVDEFAIRLAKRVYDLLLGKGQPLCRALQLALPETADTTPLSVATPTLFGALAADLQLKPPDGKPVVFEETDTKLAGFPAEPKRLVGRVGPLARANAVLAPDSGHSAVLFVGMAGAGKTACALELAYGHEQGFARLVWHKAPDEDQDITSALTNLAMDLERRLPGLKLVERLEDPAGLAAFLPQLTEWFERHRVLVVVDNVESLLTRNGDWRDPRWGMIVDALTGHDGLSRVILTSRRCPRVLDAGVVVEPIHALSLAEAVLVARELPNLGALFDGGPEVDAAAGRELVARTLAVVQGHPKLIELADGLAADPNILEQRLAEADRAWTATGARLGAFFEHGESTAAEQDYLSVLDGWTRATVELLPDPSTVLFQLLCAVEENDRSETVVEAVWADLWERLGRAGDPPGWQAALGPLVAHGLVETETVPDQPTVYRLHPGVAAAGRTTAGPGFQAAVDAELTAYWYASFRHAVEQEGQGLGWLVSHAGRAAAPYLLRLQHWDTAGWMLDHVLRRDGSPGTVAALLPLLRRIADATTGTEHELDHAGSLARALMTVRPAEAETRLRDLVDRAVSCGRFDVAAAAAGELVSLLRGGGRLSEALVLVEQMQGYTRRAGLGPWTQLGDDAQRLQILMFQGRNEQVLAAVHALRETMAGLAEHRDADETVVPWNVRELVLQTGLFAARGLGRWEEALAFNAEAAWSKRRRGASRLDQVGTRFNDYGPLLRLGRLGEARALLLDCRQVFEDAHDLPMLGKVLSALADVEDRLGRTGSAVRLVQDALRLSYAAGDPGGVAVSHFNLANYLQRGGRDAGVVVAHRLACAVIRLQTGSGRLAVALHALAEDLAGFDGDLPGSFAQLCQLMDQTDGVHLAQLVDRLPTQAPDGEAALAEVLHLASQLPRPDG